MKDRWNQEFFWTLEQGTWIQKRRNLILDPDGTTVISEIITGTTIITLSGTT